MKDQLDSIHEVLTDIKVVQARQEENLREHMRRTNAAETRLELVEDFINNDIRPHLIFVSICIKIAVALGSIVAFIAGLVELFQFFKR